MLSVMGAVAEFEHTLIRERRREGIAREFGISRQTLYRLIGETDAAGRRHSTAPPFQPPVVDCGRRASDVNPYA
jgi:DNA invertase Pin-like site-specific DNA recombinase